ncbi:hypothetical protein VZT92_005072 [Zoarces viviparus]|uniref:RING-type domain-containing protein n=1 Tax=Zoarces viviparus TaxID=48416 RepID=A0AAW1FRH4_ZOAVI
MLALSADMDESSSLLDLLECSVCLERLDTTAKVLPCQHTFCRRCLENIVSSRNELRCPECRILVDCGVDDLPANILLVRLLDGIKQRPQRGSGGGGVGPGGSLQGYAAGICASPPGSAIRELPVAIRSSPVKVGYFPTIRMCLCPSKDHQTQLTVFECFTVFMKQTLPTIPFKQCPNSQEPISHPVGCT